MVAPRVGNVLWYISIQPCINRSDSSVKYGFGTCVIGMPGERIVATYNKAIGTSVSLRLSPTANAPKHC